MIRSVNYNSSTSSVLSIMPKGNVEIIKHEFTIIYIWIKPAFRKT